MFDLQMKFAGPRTLREQIYAQLREAILDGRIAAAAQLPSSRDLARRLEVSRSTVVAAYERLAGEGLIIGQRGSATQVAAVLKARFPTRRNAAPDEARRHSDTNLGASELSKQKVDFDFRCGVTDTSLFPLSSWRRISTRKINKMLREPGGYASIQGEPELRQLIADQVSVSRGVRCRAEDVVVTSGAQQAFDLLGRVLITPATVVAVENPGYVPVRRLFESLGARVVGVPVDAQGLVVPRLPRAAKLVYTTPSHQFPLGAPMSLGRRLALLEWADANGAIIIEDDYDCEYRFDGRPLESLHGTDRRDTVAYVGTFSKVLFPGIRLGYLIAPRRLRDSLLNAKSLSDGHCSPLMQAVVAEFMASGGYQRHVRKLTREYSKRRQIIYATLDRDFEAWLQPLPSVAGLHIATKADRELDLARVIREASLRGVGIYSHATCWMGRADFPGLMLGFGGIDAARIAAGLRVLRQVFTMTSKS